MKKRSIILTGGLACSACCAPLIWPFIVGAGLGGAGLGAFLSRNLAEILCIAGIASAATGLLLWLRHRNKPATCLLEVSHSAFRREVGVPLSLASQTLDVTYLTFPLNQARPGFSRNRKVTPETATPASR